MILLEYKTVNMAKSEYKQLPRRIFLDTNVLQYLENFGEFIFDHYQENDECLVSTGGKEVLKDTKLYNEIEALRFLLLGIDRTNVEFAISESTFKEVQKAGKHNYTQWFFEMWDCWQNILREYENEIPPKSAELRLEKFNNDQSLLQRLSKTDSDIIRDAIFFDCNAVLTTDKFRNLHEEINNKYGLMVLHPSDLWELLKPWQALWY